MQSDHRALPSRCLGIVEETKQGLWRYSRLRSLSCPVFQIADSRLKNVEGRYVGEAAVRALLEDMAQLGFRRRGCTVGVLGAGIIGRAILKSASSAGLDAICWDRDPVARLEASTAGFLVTSRREVIHGADVIVGASGKRSIRIGDLREMRDGVLLASASSRRIELPITSLLREARRRDLIGHVARLELKSGKTLHVSDDGCPINFRHSSLPIELADLMFAQIAVGFGELAANLGHAPLIRRLSEPDQARIARSWTRQYLKPRR
jgi:adenosylhomocysteinase